MEELQAAPADEENLDHLLPEPVSATIGSLRTRIAARFPESGLGRVAAKLQQQVDAMSAGREASRRRTARTRLASRVLIVLIIIASLVALGLALHGSVDHGAGLADLDLLPLLESAINDIVFAAIAIAFLLALPDRVQRRGLLKKLYELRSLAHIVDMHQLSKDPERLRPDYPRTAATRPMNLNRDQLERYLEYCSELLALIGKTSALCAEETGDAVVLETVSTVENLVSGISRKVWQKIARLPAA